MMLRKIYLLLLCLLCVTVYAEDISKPSSLEGSGTADDPYLIRTAEDLQWFAQESNVLDDSQHKNFSVCAKLMNDIYYNGNKTVLNTDGTVVSDASSLKTWTPISWRDSGEPKEYLGTFDGNGYTIYGLYVKNSGTLPKGFVGFLGGKTVNDSVYSGVVKNLTIKDSYFEANGNVGGICGANYDGKIICCASYATVKRPTSSSSGNYGVGGLCGYSENGIIRNSYSKCYIDGYNRGAIIGLSTTKYIPRVISCFGGRIKDRVYPLVGGNGKAKYDNEEEPVIKWRYITSCSESNVSDFRFGTGEIAYRLNVNRKEMDDANGISSLQWGQTLYIVGDTTEIDAFPALRDSIEVERSEGNELMHRQVFCHEHAVADIAGTIKPRDYVTRWYPVDLTWDSDKITAYSIMGINYIREPYGRVLAVDAGTQSGFKGRPMILYNTDYDKSYSFAPPVHTEEIWKDGEGENPTPKYVKDDLTIDVYPYYNTVPGDWLNAIYDAPVTADIKDGYSSYVLQTVDEKRGFHIIEDGVKIKNSFYRCYLITPLPEDGSVKSSYTIDLNAPTSIETVTDGQSDMQNGNIYNLMGQRVMNTNPSTGTSRIFIVNGRKYVAR